jgi:ABC-type polar amino acid transport system ATPase subunit
MLSIKNLSKEFRGKKILDNLTFEIKRGEIALFLGASGVGKSTLLRILNNLETIDTGTITLDDKPIDLKNVNKTHMVGMVFQHFNLFEHLTVEQNITIALEKAAKKTAQEAKKIAHKLLAQYGLEDKADAYITQLSGGQKQRLALARTLALEPNIVCLDEPTSALDPLLTSYVASMIQSLAAQNYIILVATHDTTLLEKLSCTIYLMQQGRILETTTSQEFYAHKQRYPAIARFVAGSTSI